MGDTGAMLLGLMLAYGPISSTASLDQNILVNYSHLHPLNRFGTILPLLVPAAIMLIPYADLLMAVVRRTRAGTSVFSPDKKHLQHRLLAIGHSHRTSVLIMYLWATLFAGSVVWLSIARTSLYILIIVTGAAVLALALLLVSMPRLRPWARAASAASVARQDAAKAVPNAARVAPAAVRVRPEAAATVPDAVGRVPGEDAAEPRPAYSPARQQDAVTWQAAGTADPDATSPIPAMSEPAADVPAAPSPFGPGPVFGRSPAASPFQSGAAAGEPSEPAVEPAPWPGFAAEEPAGPLPEAESAPAASSRQTPESASWFEPARRRPSQRNGSAQENGSAAQQNGSAAQQNGSSAGPDSDAASWFEPAAPSYRPNGPGAD